MENNSFEEIWNKIKGSERILIPLHEGPDGDSFGACTSMKYVLEKWFGKEVKLVSKDELEQTLMKLSLAREIEFGKGVDDLDLGGFDVLILLDLGYIGGFTERNINEIRDEIFVINIDHHLTNSFYGDLNYVNPGRASACSVLFDFFEWGVVEFDKELSQRLLLGVCLDSGFFRTSNSVDSLRDANKLLEKGADYLKLLKDVSSNTPLKTRKYHSHLIDNLVINGDKRYAYSTISNDEINRLGLNLSEIRSASSHLQNIEGFDFVFALAELADRIKGSFRSMNGVDVSLFAKELGGGGHKFAAGFWLDKMPLEKAVKKVLNIIEEVGIHKEE